MNRYNAKTWVESAALRAGEVECTTIADSVYSNQDSLVLTDCETMEETTFQVVLGNNQGKPTVVVLLRHFA
jgi:hypothetical protein